MIENTARRAPVVVFACGNPDRGDDAIGPYLLERLAHFLQVSGNSHTVELIVDYQLQVEHALDLEGRRLALFIDAGSGTPAPYRLGLVQPAALPAPATHALTPSDVLAVFAKVGQGPAPKCYSLCIRGEGFALGAPLSLVAHDRCELALGRLIELWQRGRHLRAAGSVADELTASLGECNANTLPAFATLANLHGNHEAERLLTSINENERVPG